MNTNTLLAKADKLVENFDNDYNTLLQGDYVNQYEADIAWNKFIKKQLEADAELLRMIDKSKLSQCQVILFEKLDHLNNLLLENSNEINDNNLGEYLELLNEIKQYEVEDTPQKDD